MNNENDWPDSELPKGFDWSMSLSQIDKQYGLPPIKEKKRYQPPVAEHDEEPKVSLSESAALLRRWQNKFPAAYEMIANINIDLPRWICDNIPVLNKKVNQQP